MNNEVLDNQKLFIADRPAIIKSVLIFLIISCVLITPIRNISFNSPSVTSIDQRCIEYLPINILAIGKHLVLLAVVLRFIIPAEVAINNWIYDYHLKNKYNQSVDNIKTSVKEIKKRTPVEEISMEDSQEEQSLPENGFFSRTKKAIAAMGDLGAKFKEFQLWLKTEVPNLFENFISLIMVFIISTIFSPIFILWLIVYLIRIITNSQFGHKVEKKFRINIFQKKHNQADY